MSERLTERARVGQRGGDAAGPGRGTDDAARRPVSAGPTPLPPMAERAPTGAPPLGDLGDFGGLGALQLSAAPGGAGGGDFFASRTGGAGGRLPGAVQAQMERAFDADFSAVSVHPGSTQASALGARAFAQGESIHFAPGQYAPESTQGRELLGHELGHVVQQRAGRVQPTTQAPGGVGINADAGLEREADVAGARAARGEPVQMASAPSGARASGGGAVQRKVGFEFEMPTISPAVARPRTKKEQKSFDKDRERLEDGKAPKDGGFAHKNLEIQQRDYMGTGHLIDNDTGVVTGGGTNKYALQAMRKKEVAVRGTDFTLEADEGNAAGAAGAKATLEFVTAAFDETPQGRARLAAALDELLVIEQTVVALGAQGRALFHASEVHAGGVTGVMLQPYGQLLGLSGVLQATAGVDLRRVAELLRAMAAPTHESDERQRSYMESRYVLGASIGGTQHPGGGQVTLGDTPGLARAAIADYKAMHGRAPDDLGSHRLEGLLALMASYILTARGNQLGYAKTIAALMARTDFAQMFAMLPDGEQAYLSEKPDRLVRLVRRITGAIDLTGEFFPHGLYQHPLTVGGGIPNALAGLTPERWITGIASGIDFLTAASFNQNPDLAPPDPNAPKPDLESMGALGHRTERVGRSGHRRAAPIFELRALGQLPAASARQQALAIFDYLVDLNARGSRARLTLGGGDDDS